MADYKEGAETRPDSSFSLIAPTAIKAGENILFYKTSPVVFNLISPKTLSDVIHGWVWLKNEQALSEGGLLVNVLGVHIDTLTGEMIFRVNVSPVAGPSSDIPDVSEAGVNPYAVLAIVGGLLAAAGIVVVTLTYVYGRVASSPLGKSIGLTGSGGDTTDPCQGSGPLDWFSCQLNRSFYVGIGILIGIVAVFVLALVMFERNK